MKPQRRRNLSRAMLALLTPPVLLMTTAPAASAARAEHTVDAFCTNDGRIELCLTAEGFLKDWTTPSGNSLWISNFRVTATERWMASGEVFFNYDAVFRDRRLRKGETFHVVNSHFEFTWLYNGELRCGSLRVHFVATGATFENGVGCD